MGARNESKGMGSRNPSKGSKGISRSNSLKNFGRTGSFQKLGSADVQAEQARAYDQQLDFVFSTKPPKNVSRPKFDRTGSRVSESGRFFTPLSMSRSGTGHSEENAKKTIDFVIRDTYGRNEKFDQMVEEDGTGGPVHVNVITKE